MVRLCQEINNKQIAMNKKTIINNKVIKIKKKLLNKLDFSISLYDM